MTQAELQNHAPYQLWLASNAWQRLTRKALEPFGLTHVQFITLSSVRILAEECPCVNQIQVARFADLDENMTSQVIRGLEKKGLLKRLKHPTDKRAHKLKLTEEGLELQSAARTAVKAQNERVFSALGEDRDEFVRLLITLREAIEKFCSEIA